jgi:tRNA(Ile)-lysidine synthetase-like protein
MNKIVLGVSGGIDSMVLLHMLVNKQLSAYQDAIILIAHVDHGIRKDSAQDKQFVAAKAKEYGLPFFSTTLLLGAAASEEEAREARYAFLDSIASKENAVVMTAHHQDDMLETAIINLLRGTSARGIGALRQTARRRRPLLQSTKSDIRNYAIKHELKWYEDSTNTDKNYLRNYVRLDILPRLQAGEKKLLQIVKHTQQLYDEIDALLLTLTFSQQLLVSVPFPVAREIIVGELRKRDCAYSKQLIERIYVFSMTARPHKIAEISKRWVLHSTRDDIIFEERTSLVL